MFAILIIIDVNCICFYCCTINGNLLYYNKNIDVYIWTKIIIDNNKNIDKSSILCLYYDLR